MNNIILALAILLTGCVPNREVPLKEDTPEALKDCKAFWYNGATVLRCPNSSTSTRTGKSSAVVIEGVEYVEKQ